MNNPTLAVILLSGGMDSAVCAAIAKEQGYELACLHLNYGQRTQKRELKSFNDLCDFYKISNKLIVNVEHLALIGGSSLTDNLIEVSKPYSDSSDIPTSYVPFRNANILAIATSWAEIINAQYIIIGAMQLDYSGYPDCRREFFDSYEKTIDLGTKPETSIKILTPIIDFSKKDIVQKGLELDVPFELTWSCYKNDETACGECDSCALRLKGFEQAGFKDKINYQLTIIS